MAASGWTARLRRSTTRPGRWLRSRERGYLAALLVVALAVRLPLTPYHGFFFDVQFYINWGRLAGAHFFDFYSYGASIVPPHSYPNYPPLAVYTYALICAVYPWVAHVLHVPLSYDFHASPLLDALIKIPPVLADLGLTALLYAVARRVTSPGWALVAAASYAFAPVVLFDGALWGQTDGVAALGLVAALALALRRDPLASVGSGVVLALAILFKPQPVFFVPLLLVYLWRWSGWRDAARALAGLAGAGALLSLPYLLPPRPQILVFIANVQAVGKALPYTSMGAFNLWWLAGLDQHNPAVPAVGALSTSQAGWALFMLPFALALVGVWRDASPARLFASAGLVALAFFDLTTTQHERYLFPAVPLFLVAALYGRRYLPFYVITSATAFLNMLLTVLETDDRLEPAWGGLRAAMGNIHRDGALLAAVQLALLVWLLVDLTFTLFPTILPGVAAWATSVRAGPAGARNALETWRARFVTRTHEEPE
jgi:dolichyl-phosphate-mannose-protein mannosyltransferase